MKTLQRRRPILQPFGEVPTLLNDFNEKEMAQLIQHDPLNRRTRDFMSALSVGMTNYGRYGMYSPEGALCKPHFLFEQGGAGINPDSMPDFFDTVSSKLRDSVDVAPDTTYLDFLRSETMDTEYEKREDWDWYFNFVDMAQEGQVQYNRGDTTQYEITNKEYGAGLKLSWTWLETNKFKINFQRLVPKAKFSYFDMISDAIYALLVSKISSAATITQNVIRDFNVAIGVMKRKTNTFGKLIYTNNPIRVVTAWENRWIVEAILKSSRQDALSSESLSENINWTFTSKLAAPTAGSAKFYMMFDKFEKNGIYTRVPFTATLPVDDNETFARKMSFRGAYGANIETTSGFLLDFAPNNAAFVLNGPWATHAV